MSLQKRVESYFTQSKGLLDTESSDQVKHYLDHDEYEMAFEGLVIELIKMGQYPVGFESQSWLDLGKKLGLDKDSVFDGDFWSNMNEWCSKRIKGERPDRQ